MATNALGVSWVFLANLAPFLKAPNSTGRAQRVTFASTGDLTVAT